jgi:hypothetical protein
MQIFAGIACAKQHSQSQRYARRLLWRVKCARYHTKLRAMPLKVTLCGWRLGASGKTLGERGKHIELLIEAPTIEAERKVLAQFALIGFRERLITAAAH